MKQNQLKTLLLTLTMLLATIPLQAQMVSNNNDDEVNKVDPSVARNAYRPGEVIVKFKETSAVQMRCKAGKFQTSGLSKVDKVLNYLGVNEADQLMPLTGNKVHRSVMRSYSGEEIKDRDLSGLYRLRMDNANVTVDEAVTRLKELEEVDYAEPNYLVFTMSTDADTYTAEPLFTEQWGPAAINLDQLWAVPKLEGAERPVIAILDTGIDITHPDLADNIWTNSAESTGAEGEDDDNNGYADDVHGWDFINQTAKIADYNGHGTHCAGIAAAVGDNGIGITGANPDAYIMPITVFQSDGTGDVATIIQGIDYATDNGATFLSMSFGGYAYSIAEEQALAKAYSKATLVAAVGNDGTCIYPYCHPLYDMRGACFPAAFTFVLGVEAANESGRVGFSNWDCDGPIYSQYGEEQLYNYELRAPGVNIYSTYPQGRYKSMNGTSMACPLAAGAISRLMQCKSYEYQVINREILFGDLIHGANQQTGIMDIMAAYNIKDEDREPTLWLVSTELNDESEGDVDFRPDAGEIIDLYPTLRNDWGNATNIKIHLEVGENEDETIIECLTNDVDFGKNLSSYGKAKSESPIRFKIADNCADNRHIRLSLTATCDELSEPIVYDDIVIVVENGIELGGVINEDMTLYPNVHYIVTNNLAIPDGVTLTISPGVILDFKDGCGISVAKPTSYNILGKDEYGINMIDYNGGGKINAEGTAERPIIINGNGGNNETFKLCPNDSYYYVFFNNTSFSSSMTAAHKIRFNNCTFSQFAHTLCDGLFYNCNINGFNMNININDDHSYNSPSDGDSRLINCNLNNNYYYLPLYLSDVKGLKYGNYFSSNVYPSKSSSLGDICFLYYSATPNLLTTNYPCYFGSSNSNRVEEWMIDIDRGVGFGSIDLLNMLTRPVKEAHGIVWKVVVDGYDAQDEFDLLPPLGVGRHKFEVYFNRDDMDTTITPMLAMGVRPPYTQIGIAEDGFWSVKDSVSVYTAYLNITGKLQADGLNRIYVSGAKDGEHFEIPYENTRFNVLVQAAGSMATGFAAEAGMGNVKLTWNNENNDFEDAMGFNVYRYGEPYPKEVYNPHYDDQGNYFEYDTIMVSDTIRLNQMILDLETTSFTDYEVTPGETYYYYYKVLSTDLKEYDISNVVAATPLTSTLGDANASGDVDVADVITTVNYAAGMEPRPFIFEAADVNVDTEIDILDVIGIIRIITNPNAAPATASIESVAEYWVKDGVVWLETPVDLAGVQVSLDAPRNSTITPTEDLDGFEKVSTWLADNDYLFLAYNMAGRTISAGRHPILNIGANEIADIRLSDNYGHNVMATPSIVTAVETINTDGKQAVPQGIYDMMGRKLSNKASDINRLPHGIYIVNGVKVVK